jgi:hypothetical protein
MKKTPKKMVLAKETVLKLEKGELERVAGGVSANTDCTYTHCCSGSCGTASRLC